MQNILSQLWKFVSWGHFEGLKKIFQTSNKKSVPNKSCALFWRWKKIYIVWSLDQYWLLETLKTKKKAKLFTLSTFWLFTFSFFHTEHRDSPYVTYGKSKVTRREIEKSMSRGPKSLYFFYFFTFFYFFYFFYFSHFEKSTYAS